MRQSEVKPIFSTKEYLGNTLRQAYIFKQFSSTSLKLFTFCSLLACLYWERPDSHMLEAWATSDVHMVQRQHDLPFLWSRKPSMSQYNKCRYTTCSACPQCVKHHLYSVLLSGKNLVRRMSTGTRKGRFKAESQGTLLSAIVNHHRAAYSYPAFKSLVEDPWTVTKQCSFSAIHCIRDLLL